MQESVSELDGVFKCVLFVATLHKAAALLTVVSSVCAVPAQRGEHRDDQLPAKMLTVLCIRSHWHTTWPVMNVCASMRGLCTAHVESDALL